MGVRILRRSLVLSFLVHILIVFAWVMLVQWQAPRDPSKKLTWIEVDPLPKSAKKKDEADSKRKNVVQTTPGEKTDKAKPDSFLGWQNQTVDRETVGKQQNIGNQGANSKPNIQTQTKANQSPKNVAKSKEPNHLSKLGIPLLKKPSESTADQPNQPEWATPGTRPEDYVQGIPQSDRTALNTREYQFYSYFQRIRERLDRAWVPILRERLVSYYRSGRHLASDMDHTTRVMVILNDRGAIVRVQLLGESGTSDLDDAAIAAFNRAGPFPNPPKGMVDGNKEVKIPWDFVLKT